MPNVIPFPKAKKRDLFAEGIDPFLDLLDNLVRIQDPSLIKFVIREAQEHLGTLPRKGQDAPQGQNLPFIGT